MNILITGAGGFVGQRLAFQLQQKHHVVCLQYDRGDLPGMIHGDVTNYRRMLEIIVNHEIDQIYHLAARSIVRNCRSDPLGCFDVNVMGTATVLEAARQAGRISGIVVMESDKAYGHGPVPYVETQALRPEGIYESSKACVNHLMRCYHKNYGLPVFSIRSANIYGPGDLNLSRLVPNTITRLLRGEHPQITHGADEYVREFIYLDDVCQCLQHLMSVKPWGETINIGSGEVHSVRDIIGILCDLMGVAWNYEYWPKPDTLTEISTQYLCLDKLKSLYPAFSPTSIADGLKNTIDWYKQHQQ